MGRGALLHENDRRRQDRVSRRELQRKFPPGAMGVWGTTMFTVVGWAPVAATPAVPSRGPDPVQGYFTTAKAAQPASWEVAVLVGQRLLTWQWTVLKSCKTLEEWTAEEDAVP